MSECLDLPYNPWRHLLLYMPSVGVTEMHADFEKAWELSQDLSIATHSPSVVGHVHPDAIWFYRNGEPWYGLAKQYVKEVIDRTDEAYPLALASWTTDYIASPDTGRMELWRERAKMLDTCLDDEFTRWSLNAPLLAP